MEQRISVLTLGADNLEAMKNFYGALLGWKAVADNEDIVFYQLNGFLLSICKRKSLADFIGINTERRGFSSVTLGYNVESKAAVISLFNQLKNKVKILKEPTEPPFGGLFFYFTDIENNLWEVAYNPFVTFDLNKNVVGHQAIDIL